MKNCRVAFLFFFGVTALDGALARAQYGYAGPSKGVSASATEMVSVKPDKLRLLMQIKAQGIDAKSALASMNEHKEKVKKELEAMKADKDTIVFSPIRASTGDADSNGNSRRMMQMQMQMQMSQGRKGKPTAPKPLPTVYTVTCTVKAEWPLSVKEGDALALLPMTLKEQIASRDIAGEKNKPTLGKAEQEQLDELEAMMTEQNSYGGDSNNANGPIITFIAKVPEELQQKATAAAFKKAVKEIESTSGATGIKLGKLTGVTSASAIQDRSEMYAASRYGGAPNAISSSFLKEDSVNVSDTHADELSYAVTITVSYDIE